jgi:hypothetical protein
MHLCRVAGQREAIAAAAQCLDGPEPIPRIELASQATDEHLDDVAVAVIILFVELLGEIGLRNDFARLSIRCSRIRYSNVVG